MAIKYPRSPQALPDPSPNAMADVVATEQTSPFGEEVTVSESVETPLGEAGDIVSQGVVDPSEIETAKAVAKFIKEEVNQSKDVIADRLTNSKNPYVEVGAIVAPITKDELDAIRETEIPTNYNAIPALLSSGNEAAFRVGKLQPNKKERMISLMSALDSYSKLGDPDFGKEQQIRMTQDIIRSLQANEKNAGALADISPPPAPLGQMQSPQPPTLPQEQSLQQQPRGLLGASVPQQDIA